MINTLWNIRTEALMLEEGLSTILIAPLTGEVKDVGVNEVVGLASDDETEVVENASDDCCFHGVNPFFPWRSSLGVMPYALGVTISAGTVLCVSHPGLEPAMAALRGMVRFLTIPIQDGGFSVAGITHNPESYYIIGISERFWYAITYTKISAF